LPGLTRQSVVQRNSRSPARLEGFSMDARIKPAHDED
jgi:hypothetical protein